MQLYKIDQYFEFHFSTQRFDTGAATDADATPTYRVYEENNDTVIANGDTSKVDDANTTGYYKARAQVTTAAGYEVGKVYHVRVAATVNSVAGAGVVGSFTVLPALVYDSLVGGTDNLQVDAVQWLGTACAAPTTAGVPEVDLTHIAGAAVSATTAQLGVNVVQISGDGPAADNLEAACDGTTYNVGGGAVVAASVTGAVGSVTGAVGSVTGAVGSVTGNVGGNVAGSVASVTGAVGSVTGNVGGNVTGSVGSVAAGGIAAASFAAGAIDATAIANGAIDAATFAAGAINAAAIATDAIDADALAADALTEIFLAIMKTDWTGITGESARSVLNALRMLRNKWSISGTTLTVTKEDDSTAAWTSALTTSASAEPITASDPAGP